MNSSRLWTLGSVLVIIGLIAGTWFVGISPQLAEAAKANAENESVEQLNARHSVTLEALKQQFEGLPELQEQLDELQLAVPESDASAQLLRQIQSFAEASGVTVTNLTLNSPERFAAPAEAPADAELATALGSVNPENFLIIPVEQTVTGTYGAIMNYVDAVQTGQRAFLISDVNMGSGLPAADAQVEVTLSGQVFVLLSGASAAPVGGAEAPVAGEAVPQ